MSLRCSLKPHLLTLLAGFLIIGGISYDILKTYSQDHVSFLIGLVFLMAVVASLVYLLYLLPYEVELNEGRLLYKTLWTKGSLQLTSIISIKDDSAYLGSYIIKIPERILCMPKTKTTESLVQAIQNTRPNIRMW